MATPAAEIDVDAKVKKLVTGLAGDSESELHAAIEELSQLNASGAGAQKVLSDVRLIEAGCYRLLVESLGEMHDAPFCAWLYAMYQSGRSEACRYVLRFTPALIWIYSLQQCFGTVSPAVEAIVLVVYNSEVVRRNNAPLEFSPPSLFVPSVYARAKKQQLTERALEEHNRFTIQRVVYEAPLPEMSQVTAGTWTIVVEVLIKQYTSIVTALPLPSRLKFCRVCSRIASAGYPFAKESTSVSGPYTLSAADIAGPSATNASSKLAPGDGTGSKGMGQFREAITTGRLSRRIILSERFMHSLVTPLSYCLHLKDSATAARSALECLRTRSRYDLVPSVDLTVTALLDSDERQRAQSQLDTTSAGAYASTVHSFYGSTNAGEAYTSPTAAHFVRAGGAASFGEQTPSKSATKEENTATSQKTSAEAASPAATATTPAQPAPTAVPLQASLVAVGQ